MFGNLVKIVVIVAAILAVARFAIEVVDTGIRVMQPAVAVVERLK